MGLEESSSSSGDEVEEFDVPQAVNEVFAALESWREYDGSKQSPFEYEALKGRRIVMVDDEKIILESFVQSLLEATEGAASFVHYRGGLFDELIQAILGIDPEIVLMDYHLSGSLSGDMVIRELLATRSDIFCIGFSSREDIFPSFLRAGAIGNVLKDTFNPSRTLVEVSNAIYSPL
jgi:CheY-like chemotaxis protein